MHKRFIYVKQVAFSDGGPVAEYVYEVKNMVSRLVQQNVENLLGDGANEKTTSRIVSKIYHTDTGSTKKVIESLLRPGLYGLRRT